MGQVHSQSVFNQLDTNSLVLSEVVESNSNYFMNGKGFNPSGTAAIILYKLDSSGLLIELDTFSTDGIAQGNSQLLKVDDKFALFNVTNNVYPYNGSTSDLFFSLFDSLFNVEISFSFGGNQEELAFDMVHLDTSFYLFAGTMSYGNGSGDFYLTKLGNSGVIEWSKTYGSVNTEYPRSMVSTNDNKLLLLGVKRIVSPDWDLYLVKVDPSDGSIIWERQYGGPYEDYAGEVTSLHDHSIIIYHNVKNAGISHVGYIEKLDGNGDLLWSKAFPYNDLSSFSLGRAIENPDGTLIVNNAVKNSNGKMISRILKLDPFGNILWEKEYFANPNMPQYINDIKPTSDGGYILCGSAIDNNLVQRAWFLKTNCNGEDGTQYPVTGAFCDQYECTLYPIDASFTSSTTFIDLATEPGMVIFENNSANTSSRVWDFGDGITEYTDSIKSHAFTQPGVYEVKLIVFHGMCSDTVTKFIEVVNTAGVDSPYLDHSFKIFPNPSSEILNVKFAYPPVGTLMLTDITGRIQKSYNLDGSNENLVIDKLASGSYMVNYYHKGGSILTERVVIK